MSGAEGRPTAIVARLDLLHMLACFLDELLLFRIGQILPDRFVVIAKEQIPHERLSVDQSNGEGPNRHTRGVFFNRRAGRLLQ